MESLKDFFRPTKLIISAIISFLVLNVIPSVSWVSGPGEISSQKNYLSFVFDFISPAKIFMFDVTESFPIMLASFVINFVWWFLILNILFWLWHKRKPAN